MNDLLFSLNATMPVFLVMVAGFAFHQLGFIDDVLASKLNRFVFIIPLPVMLFRQLAETDFTEMWDTRFVLFCFCVTLLSIALAWLLSHFLTDISKRGEFIQAAYRSSAAILGIAYIQNIYGDAKMAPLMIIGAVPLYNFMAVVVLMMTAEKPDTSASRSSQILKTLRGIITNPIIIGIVAGIIWSVLRIPMPSIADKTLGNIANVATPCGLMALGASIDLKKVKGEMPPAILAVFIKLIGLEAVFLPIAVSLGFRKEKLVAILIMLGSPTTVTSFVMAKSMGHEGTLTSNAVVLSTLLSAFTLTFFVFILRHFGLI